MKKILASFLLFSFFSLSASAATNPIDPDPQVDALERIFLLLDAWADQYPQCYQVVADIKESVAALQILFADSYDELLRFHTGFSTFAQDFSSYQSLFYTLSEENKNLLNEISSNVLQLSLDLNSQNDFLYPALSEIVGILEKLPDFASWSPTVRVSNYIDLKALFRELFGEIVVNCHLESDPNYTFNAKFDFNYDYFLPIKQFNEKANRSYFFLNSYTRYIPGTWIYNSDVAMDNLINTMQNSASGVDFLDFLCACGNALVSQNEDISVLLCQILGFFKSSKGDDEQLRTMATTAADDASQDLDSLKNAFHASSLEDVASMYIVDLSIDDHFDTDFLGFGHGSGSSCPEFIDIGPIPFSKIHSSMTDYTLHFSTAGLRSFFDICRQCFTVVWYLFFLTICIFLARFGWAFLKPILRTLTSVLNW